ncbi:MAG: trigger factor [Spirochaetia bacterium]|nr:trigger factor [Spirochaetia bacterium]
MVVTKNIEKLEHSAARLTVTVSKDDVRAAYDGLIKEYAKDARVDGFRKGKVPATILERKFGPQLKLDAMGRVMDQAVEAALEGETLLPLSYAQPALDGQPEFELGSDFSFSVTYDVFPDVVPGTLDGVEIELPQVAVAKADEDRELEEIRERNAIVMDKEDKVAAKKGDIATVNYSELDENDQLVEGSERQDFVFEIGSGHNLYKFDDECIGLKKGGQKVFEKTFPADFEYSEFAGMTKKIKVELTKLKEKKLPALDDELAQDVSEKFATLADLKADIKAKLDKRLEDRLRSLREKAIIDALVESSSVDAPASMIGAELEMRLRNLMQRMGIENEEKLAQIVSMSGRSIDQLREEWRPEAEKAIKTRLVMDKLVAAGAYEASEEDIATEYSKMASESSLSVEEVKAEYERRGMVEYLTDRIKEDKLLADLEKKVKVKKGKKIAFVDLFKENE